MSMIRQEPRKGLKAVEDHLSGFQSLKEKVMLGIVLLCAAALAALLVPLLACSVPLADRRPTAYTRLTLLALLLLAFGVFIFVGPGTATACPPAQQLNAGCPQQIVAPQAIVQPQAVYAAPLVQQQVVSPFYQQQIVQRVVAQPVIVQQVRQHHAQAIVQQVQVQRVVQPRAQVQRSRTVIRNR